MIDTMGLEPQHKNNIQLERIALFSVAVFAIAITLLLIAKKITKLLKLQVE